MSDFDKAITTLTKKYGNNTLIKVGDASAMEIPRIHSGSYLLDDILGGGFPIGRMIEIFGPESSGKTNLGWARTMPIIMLSCEKSF